MTSTPDSRTPRVKRSAVEVGKTYSEYKQPLRRDFVWMCAYCTRTEAEAASISFTIDHYEPKSARPDLENVYSNLMWCCDLCNKRKLDVAPPPAARVAGRRFYRPDEDIHDEHFEHPKGSVRVNGRTEVGDFTIQAVDLNRLDLRRLRETRRALYGSDAAVAEGLRAIQGARIDRLPMASRVKVQLILKELTDTAAQLRTEIDAQLVEMMSKSPDLDPLPAEEEARNEERLKLLRAMRVAYPGVWHGRTVKKAKKKRAKKK